MDTLLAERDDLLARLAAPGATDDVDALATRADEVVAEIEALQVRAARAAEARSRLAGAQVPAPRGSGEARGTGPLGEARGTGTEGAGSGEGGDEDDLPVITGRGMARTFTRSTALAEFRARGNRGECGIEVPGDTRALVTTGNHAQPQATRVPGVVAEPDRPTRILDLIDRRPTTTDNIEYVQETLADSHADFVAEGQLKPEAEFTSVIKNTSTSTVATWVNITRQASQNDSLLMGYIEGRLTYGLGRKLEADVLAGPGTAPRLRGILATSGLGSYTAAAGEAALLSIRKAKTVAALSEYFPDAVAMSPVDWERVELSSDTTGAFRIAQAQGTIAPRAWGLTVVETTSVTGTSDTVGGDFLLGGFREGATLWERTGISVYLTDSHEGNFTKNILTLLAEMQAGLTVWRPRAFVKGKFSTGTN